MAYSPKDTDVAGSVLGQNKNKQQSNRRKSGRAEVNLKGGGAAARGSCEALDAAISVRSRHRETRRLLGGQWGKGGAIKVMPKYVRYQIHGSSSGSLNYLHCGGSGMTISFLCGGAPK